MSVQPHKMVSPKLTAALTFVMVCEPICEPNLVPALAGAQTRAHQWQRPPCISAGARRQADRSADRGPSQGQHQHREQGQMTGGQGATSHTSRRCAGERPHGKQCISDVFLPHSSHTTLMRSRPRFRRDRVSCQVPAGSIPETLSQSTSSRSMAQALADLKKAGKAARSDMEQAAARWP